MATDNHTPFDSTTEEWRDIPGFEGLYQVSNLGGVYSIRSKKALALNKTVDGYLAVNLCKSGKTTRFRVHRLVMQVFVGDCPGGSVVDHINRIRTDNRLWNLQYLDFVVNSEQGAPINSQRNKSIYFAGKLTKA